MDTTYLGDGSSPCLRAPVRAWLFLSSRPAARILPRAPTAESLARKVLLGAKGFEIVSRKQLARVLARLTKNTGFVGDLV